MRAVLRPWTCAATWWGLVQLSTGVFVGAVTTVWVLSAAVTVLSIAILVPVAVLGAWTLFVVAHAMARFERARYRTYCGLELPDPCGTVQGTSWWSRLVFRLRSPARWRELAYLALRLPVSLVLFGATATIWAFAAAFAALPGYVSSLPGSSVGLGAWRVDGGPGVWIVAALGWVLFVVAAPWATNAATLLDMAFGRSLLSAGTRAEMERRVVRLESSRVAAVDSAESERRRIERDLHDGAQQRLIAAAMDLGVARERLVSDPEAGRELVGHAHDEVKAALGELRDLVRGIHPVILEDRGLDAALSAVVARAGLPVELEVVTEPRPSPAVESAAYFIVCEAITNITRHAGASRASVTIRGDRSRLRLHVHDDGRGGADPARGTGLAGLADRVDALGGTLELDSPAGGPTDLRVELPCAS